MRLFTVMPSDYDIVPGFKVDYSPNGRAYVSMGSYSLPLSDELLVSAKLTHTGRLLQADISIGRKLQLTPSSGTDRQQALVLMGTTRYWSTDLTAPAVIARAEWRSRCAYDGAYDREKWILARLDIGDTVGLVRFTERLLPARAPATRWERLVGVKREWEKKIERVPIAVLEESTLRQV
jgi:hypothetical protein